MFFVSSLNSWFVCFCLFELSCLGSLFYLLSIVLLVFCFFCGGKSLLVLLCFNIRKFSERGCFMEIASLPWSKSKKQDEDNLSRGH